MVFSFPWSHLMICKGLTSLTKGLTLQQSVESQPVDYHRSPYELYFCALTCLSDSCEFNSVKLYYSDD